MKGASLSAEPAADSRIDAPRKKYQVLGHLHVDGVDLAPKRDEVVSVELTDFEAKGLLAVGVIGPMPQEPEPNT